MSSLKQYLVLDLTEVAKKGLLGGDGKSVVAVLGNEAGDLDTFVSSVALAWHRHQVTDTTRLAHLPVEVLYSNK